MSAFELRGVDVAYAGAVAVAGLDLSVQEGEILVLVAPSGCGKSTLLRVLAGLLPSSGGDVRFDGRSVSGPAAERAVVFQDDALLPWRTVRANVELPLALAGVGRRERRARAEQMIERVGLGGFSKHLPRQLSGGMRQRAQLARTLIGEPRVILMDEPFGALDAQSRRAAQRLLVDVWEQQKTTVVFVTHDVDEALLLGDRIVVLTERPARVSRIVAVPKPRAAGAQFAPEFARLRYEILALLGDGTSPGMSELAAAGEA